MRARVSALLVLAACAVRTPIGELQPEESSTTMQGSSGDASSTDEIPMTSSTSQATTSAGPGTTTVDDGMTAEATSIADTSFGGTTDPTASGSDTDPTAGSTTG